MDQFKAKNIKALVEAKAIEWPNLAPSTVREDKVDLDVFVVFRSHDTTISLKFDEVSKGQTAHIIRKKTGYWFTRAFDVFEITDEHQGLGGGLIFDQPQFGEKTIVSAG